MELKPAYRVRELEERLKRADYQDQRVDTLLELAREVGPKDPQRALEYAIEALELSQTGEFNPPQVYQRGMADSNYLIGTNHLQMGDYPQAQSHFFNAVKAYEEMHDRPALALASNGIAVAYLYSGAYADALSYFLEAYKIFQETGRHFRLANILNNIGLIYLRLGDLERAQKYLEDGLGIAREGEDERAAANALDNLCRVYTLLGDFDSALNYGIESVDTYQKTGTPRGEAEALDSLGSLYLAQKDYSMALSYFQRSLEISRSIGYRQEMVEALRRIGDVHFCQNDFKPAREYILQALNLAEQIGDRQKTYECHRALVDVNRQAGGYKRALYHYEQFHKIKETVFNEETDKRLKNLEMQYQVEAARRDTEIYQLKNVALQFEIEEHEQLIDDLNAFAQTVAHDLKNPLQRQLLAVKLLSILMEKHKISPDAAEYLTVILKTTEKMNNIVDELLFLASVRQKEIDLQPLVMNQIVQEAVDRLADLIKLHQGEVIKPENWPASQGYAPWVEEIWVNYISNAIKYGGSPPRVELGAEELGEGKVRYWVKDNGNGIQEEAKSRLFTAFSRVDKDTTGYGLGLSIVKRIVNKLGGEVSMYSTGIPGEGSTFSFTLPAVATEP